MPVYIIMPVYFIMPGWKQICYATNKNKHLQNAAVLEKSANEHVLKMKAYKSNNVSLTNQSCASKLNGIMFMLLRLQ